MATFTLFLAYPLSFKVFYFHSKIAYNLLISFLLLNNLSVAQNATKEITNMHIFHFGCLATNLLDFL